MSTISNLTAAVTDLAVTTGNALQARGFKSGGTVGQVPVKASGSDFDWTWGDTAGSVNLSTLLTLLGIPTYADLAAANADLTEIGRLYYDEDLTRLNLTDALS